ncbi:response regulator transcription factor [Blastopirellula marina]|uniref:DNA-binding response regulator n=1 Tax=Blastopirellula marina TaxID=124 RepID=A0A2S8G988_9BACT|nr:response regulator transcription factor [Blastopirellula marina]PQO41028.1 DNA-binding response regulator [Blastopirellula marina]PTL45904.1 DNA-binding response regulator [Blastopirellula marina]
MPKILVIEDQPNLLRSISRALAEAGFDAVSAASLTSAQGLLAPNIDLVILDLMLPDGNGLDWLSELKATGNRTAVLVLTARDSINDRVAGLDAGADDYMVKPFAMAELLARIRMLLRRGAREPNAVISFGDLQVDLLSRTVKRGKQTLDLQNRQVELLVVLMKHANQIVTREMIAQAVWKENTATWTNVIAVNINQLRKKLEIPGRPAILHTIRGKGYLLGDAP